MDRQGFIFLTTSLQVAFSIAINYHRDFHSWAEETEMDQDTEGFQKSNQSHYKEANSVSGDILVVIRGS